MADTTGIEWTDKTWNPWYGCTKVSPGCARCYMYREQTRYRGTPDVVQRSKTKFAEPLRWKEPARVFTCSWSDWFHEDADAWRDEAWDIVRRSPHLVFQILTKRPERIAAHLPKDWGDGWPNVWLGTSVENQRFVERATVLARVPAAVRFLSCEPLLGPLSFRWVGDITYRRDPIDGLLHSGHLDLLKYSYHWVIVGGESGPMARPMDLAWARTLRDQCAEAGVAFFLKQLGGHPNARAHDAAVLDGVRHTAMPAVWTERAAC